MRGFRIGDTVRWHPTEGSPFESLTVTGEVADGGMLLIRSVTGESHLVDPSVAPGRMVLIAPARNHDPGDEDRSER